MEVIKEQVNSLLQLGLYDSAVILGQFLLSAASHNSDGALAARCETMVMFADALFGKNEYRRALNVYRQALQQSRIAPRTGPGGRGIGPPKGLVGGAVMGTPVPGFPDVEVRYKMAQCHLLLKERDLALHELEAIPQRSRDVRMNLTLARLYHNKGFGRAAVNTYKECLKQCPFLVEAVNALAQLGVPLKDFSPFTPEALVRAARPSTDMYDPVRWLTKYAEAQCAVAAHDYRGAAENYSGLSMKFPNNLHLLLETAKAEAADGKVVKAVQIFEKARQLDVFNVDAMDEYAFLIKQKGDGIELNRLTHDLLNIDPKRPEAWVASALFWEYRDDKMRALTYADKGTQADDRHVLAHLIKGSLSLTLHKAESALSSFKMAHSLRADLRAYQGVVRAYLSVGKSKEALVTAREAVRSMPSSPWAITLLGDVFASQSETRDKARKCFNDALKLDPACMDAVISMAELYKAEDRFDDAVNLLQKHLRTGTTDMLHAELAKVLVAANKFGDALSHYNAALSINPKNEVARKGLERLEKMMKGVDPDALEEDEEQDNDDNDNDNEDGDFS